MHIDRDTLRWHYTVGIHFKRILASGLIKQSTKGVLPDEKPVVWFTKSAEWDQTANKFGLHNEALTMDETHKKLGGLVRIGVAPETAPHDWKAFKKLSGIPHKIASGLYSIAISKAVRPGDWFVSFEPVPAPLWLAIEYWNGFEWVPDNLPTVDYKLDHSHPIPIDALFNTGSGPNLEADPRQILRDCNIIFGLDVMTQNQFLVFGSKQLDRIIKSGTAEPVISITVEVDQETDDLEKLLALVQAIKGYHDYKGPGNLS